MPKVLTLYHAPASPNSRRVRMFLAEKGISVPLVSIDLAAGEQHGEAYRAINPRRVVPTLVLEGGTAIGEVLAIWRYLEETYPSTPLLGTSPKDKALVTMWASHSYRPMTLEAHLDWRVLAFTAGVSLLTGFVFGLAPAFRGSDIGLTSSLKAGNGDAAMGQGSPVSRRRFLRLAAGGLVSAAGWYTWRIEPHWVEIVRRDRAVACAQINAKAESCAHRLLNRVAAISARPAPGRWSAGASRLF